MPNHASWDDPESPHYYEQPGQVVTLPHLVKPLQVRGGMPWQRGKYDDVPAKHNAEADLTRVARMNEHTNGDTWGRACHCCHRFLSTETGQLCGYCSRAQARHAEAAAVRDATLATPKLSR